MFTTDEIEGGVRADALQPGKQTRPDGTIIRLAGRDLEVVRLRSFAERYAVLEPAARHQRCAAALGLSWPALRRHMERDRKGYSRDRDARRFADDVIDYLSEQGATMAQIIEAGTYAAALQLDNLPTRDGIEAAQGNSEAPVGASTDS